jgi:hypothetical protein
LGNTNQRSVCASGFSNGPGDNPDTGLQQDMRSKRSC